ncbi:hypothetical protein K1719_036098 [Acacia pycnantha]|nr:hypothetical protein K1719_036098 [Acacia pycnantha]
MSLLQNLAVTDMDTDSIAACLKGARLSPPSSGGSDVEISLFSIYCYWCSEFGAVSGRRWCHEFSRFANNYTNILYPTSLGRGSISVARTPALR